MYKLCKTEQSARRQREIEDVLLILLAQTQYEDIPVSDLCRRLDMPTNVFYRFFPGRDGALFALIDHRLMEYGSGSREDRGIRFHAFYLDLEWFFEFWHRQKALLDALERSGISGILVERAIRNTQEAVLFELPEEQREYANAATAFAVCGLMSMVLQWHQSGYRQSVSEMAALAWRLLGSPLAPGLEKR